MKALKLAMTLAGLMIVSAGCQKSMVAAISSESSSSVSAVSCKGQTAPVDPSDLKIEGAAVAQAGRTATLKLNHDLSCSNSQKVNWESEDGTILAQSVNTLLMSFPSAGRFSVSAHVKSTVAGFAAAKAESEMTTMVMVVGGTPMISGPQVGIVGRPYQYSLGLPEGFTAQSVSWSFGDISSMPMGIGPVSHTWGMPGTYEVKAVIVDGNDNVSTVSHRVNIIDVFDGTECVVDTAITAPAEGHAGQPVDLSVYLPSCIKDAVSSVSWDFGDASNGTGTAVQHTYATVGDYTITVNVYAPYVPPGTPFITLTQTIHITEVPPQPSPTPTPTPGPTATPAACELNATRESTSDPRVSQVACGTDGSKTMTYQTRIIELCKVVDGVQGWSEISRTEVLKSEGACVGQSCTLPDGSKLGNGQSRVLYSSNLPNGSCTDVSQARTCNNGTLSGSTSYQSLTCNSGCGDFGKHGTVKTGVVTGSIQVPLACSFGEEGFANTFTQLSDQRCTDGSVVSSNTRQGTMTQAGSCPTYAWVATSTWTQCTADCGGKQTLMHECRNDKGAVAPSDRCVGAAPVQERLCDANPEAVKRVETATSQESAGSTAKCPANQIGVIVSERTVMQTKTYACIDHAVKLASDVKSYGNWVEEKYCRDYVAHRCSQDSLSITEANGRYQWMLKCQDQVPQIKEFLTEFKDVKVSGGYTISSTSRPLYPTFMNTASTPEKVWIAPKSASGSCAVPEKAYVASVCLSSCATPDQEILVQAKANLQLKYMPFVDALLQNAGFVATLQSNSSMSSKTVVKTKVDQWVTEMMDTEHDIIEFRMQSGRVLKLTSNHPVLTSLGMMKSAGDFKAGEDLVMLGGTLDRIVTMDHVKYFGKVYNVFVQSADVHKNIVVTNGYLNGTAFFQNEGANNLNRALFRTNLTRGAF